MLTSSIDAQTTQTFCCPTSYNLYNVEFDRPSFPSQCVSTLTDGQVLEYRTVTGNTNSATSTTVDGETITIYGIPVNGLNVISSTSTSAAQTTKSSDLVMTYTSTGTAGQFITVTATASAASTQTTSTSGDENVSVVGVAVGASVGAVAGIFILAVGAFIIYRRRKSKPLHSRSAPALEMDASQHSLGTPERKSLISSMWSKSPKMPPQNAAPAELDGGREVVAYELPAESRST